MRVPITSYHVKYINSLFMSVFMVEISTLKSSKDTVSQNYYNFLNRNRLHMM